MGRSVSSVVCFAIVAAGCASAPVPAPEFTPVPMTETAPSGDESMPVGESVEAAEAMGEEMPVVDLEYVRSAVIDHEWVGDNSARIKVLFCISYSTVAGQSELAVETMSANWRDACQRARLICESADLFDEEGRIFGEQVLCLAMNEMLFGNGDGTPIGTVERVIWKRLTWQ